MIAQERPQDVGAAAGERDDGLLVGAALGAFLQVVVAAGPFAHHAGLRGQVEDTSQRAAIPAGGLCRFPVRRPESLGTGHQAWPGGGEVAGAGEGRQVSRGD